MQPISLAVMALVAIVTTTCYARLPPGPALAQIDPHIVHLGVTDRHDLRFVRLAHSTV